MDLFMTQCQKILEYLKEYGSITPLDALKEFGCMRLAARIADLIHQGYQIDSNIENSINRSGEKVHYARYTLIA